MTDAQLAQIVALLTEIRDWLAYLCQPVEEEAPAACEHAENNRTDFSTPREVHWHCNACGYVERHEVHRAPAGTPRASAEE